MCMRVYKMMCACVSIHVIVRMCVTCHEVNRWYMRHPYVAFRRRLKLAIRVNRVEIRLELALFWRFPRRLGHVIALLE